MKVFISWSGERSRLVAELFRWWLPSVIQALKPWVSSSDIDGGSIWFTEINNQLADTSVGIVCLTQSNKNKPWILFESGALAKGLAHSRVCTFLIDLSDTDVKDPLAQFNHTLPESNSLLKLIRNINATLGDNKLDDTILQRAFTTYWPQFEKEFNKILSNTPEEEVKETREEDDILRELLTTVRGIENRVRNFELNTDIQQDKIHRPPNSNIRAFNSQEELDKYLAKLDRIKKNLLD